MLSQLRPAVTMIALFTLLTGAILPPLFVQIGALVFPFQAGGSLIVQNGKVVGSALIGQSFTADKYFHGRPSALMGTDFGISLSSRACSAIRASVASNGIGGADVATGALPEAK